MNALHRFLVDFDLELAPVQPAAPAWGADAESLSEPEALPWLGEGAPEDLDGDLAFEVNSGELAPDGSAEAAAALLAEAEARHAADLVALAATHAESLAAERARWVADEGARLAEGLARARTEIEDALADGAAAVLESFLEGAVRDAAIIDLRRAVSDLVVSGTAASIAVTGPADLVEALRNALAAEGVEDPRIGFAEAETVEVTITADVSTIQTRLGAWTRMLQRRLGDPQ